MLHVLCTIANSKVMYFLFYVTYSFGIVTNSVYRKKRKEKRTYAYLLIHVLCVILRFDIQLVTVFLWFLYEIFGVNYKSFWLGYTNIGQRLTIGFSMSLIMDSYSIICVSNLVLTSSNCTPAYPSTQFVVD